MKNLNLILLFLLFTNVSMGQKKFAIVDEYGPVKYGVSALSSGIPLFISVDKNTKSIDPFNHIPNDPLGTVVFLDGATTANVTTRLRKDSLPYYRYSVIENDSITLVADAPLKKIDFVWNKYSDWPGYLTMNLDLPNIANKKITVKIYRYPKPNLVTTLIIYNKSLKRVEIVDRILATEGTFSKKDNRYLVDTTFVRNGAKINVTDKTKGMWVSFQKTDLDFAYGIYLIYQTSDKTVYKALPPPWSYNNYDGNPGYFITADHFSKPGDYGVAIRNRKINNGDTTSLYRPIPEHNFSVMPLYSTRQLIVIIAVVILIALFVILIIRIKSRKKIALAAKQTETTRNELNMVRAQLNPHFVFNALSGIQNLMNKNDVEMANDYLNKFARLTRQVLDDKTMISIKDEIALLDDYLAMEQLRFSFKYKIDADSSDNFTNTEIPVMLLQPFVENAVKHGIAHLKNEGQITVSFTRHNKQLMLTVTDNGKGFNTSQNFEGLGLKLSKKRIALLNDVYKECPITLVMDSTPGNTLIKITLAHWL